ncbi:TPR repeat family protein [Clavispora lusitaniae]|uniref:TPR repeat family protein n=1 Tax=Clavispora lusitaniae TaxID=36911 RepID=UPI00202C3D43|nr:TPR repeat family protein [Clavispora lusitaniae]
MSADPHMLAQLVLLEAKENVSESDESAIGQILVGDYASVLRQATDGFQSRIEQTAQKYPEHDLDTLLRELASTIVEELPSLTAQFVGVCLLQLFLQANFTGPEPPVSAKEMFFAAADADIQKKAARLLDLEGKTAYELMYDPLLLVLALLVFERLQQVPRSVSLVHNGAELEKVVEHTQQIVAADAEAASLSWWRARALQTHLSVLEEPADVLATATGLLLTQSTVDALVGKDSQADESLRRRVQLSYLLESARSNVHAQTEHLAPKFLREAADVSQMQFVLTGARAKRTKFQTFHTASLLLLAKSADESTHGSAPRALPLDSDLLLEKPEYEIENKEENESEKEKEKEKEDENDPQQSSSLPSRTVVVPDIADPHRLFPVCSTIPAELRSLDPNNQPPLSDLDCIQLLLRVATVRQTSPSGNTMVEEELSAVVRRIVYAARPASWSVFGRALWERSVLETNSSRTVERGILQMTALVEEMGVHVATKTFGSGDEAPVCERLRYIHQLPLMSQWAMDAALAEKYMALGVLKSAIDIYERLHMPTEAALCYAAVDDEAAAERLLRARLDVRPDDARALSVLGDIKQDPALWQRAWDVGRYAKAKASLARYAYRPSPGVERNVPLALDHMRECLAASPLSYDNWFFYGCGGLETANYELAAEAFTRCVALDDTNSHAWSNLASAQLRLGKKRQALGALKRALQQGEGARRSWRIFQNYVVVAAQLGEWNDVLHGTRQLVEMRRAGDANVPLDVPVLEQLAQVLVAEPYDAARRAAHFQAACTDLLCAVLPAVADEPRCWKIVARVELWRGRAWAALEAHEKAYRAAIARPVDVDEAAWAEAVDACADLVAAYESLGEREGKHGAVVCKDWKYKARSSVRALMSRGREWEGSAGWEKLEELRDEMRG